MNKECWEGEKNQTNNRDSAKPWIKQIKNGQIAVNFATSQETFYFFLSLHWFLKPMRYKNYSTLK